MPYDQMNPLNKLSPEVVALLHVLQDTSPRPDGTLTPYEEKVRLAWPLLTEQFSATRFFKHRHQKLDEVFLIRWLGSHWNNYPEPDANFVPKT